jgi:hypothetical protein
MRQWMKPAAYLLAGLALWTVLHKLADRVLPPETLAYSIEATACAEGRQAAIDTIDDARATVAWWEAQVPPIQTRLAGAEATAQVLQDVCAPSETPTPTATPWPTVTPTPLPGVLCKTCIPGQPDNTLNGCASGYTCWPCSGYKCLDKTSLSGSCTTCRNQPGTQESAGADGLAVYHIYDVDHNALVGAVDCTVKDALKGKTLRICTIVNPAWHQYEQRCVDVTVTDCGRLYDAGLHSYQVKPVGDMMIARWWPGNELVVLVDLSPAAMRVLSPELETVAVKVEVLE